MSRLLVQVRRSTLPVLIVLCLAALTVSYAFAKEAQRPLATQVIGDPDAAVTGMSAAGPPAPGNKALTVVGVIDFLGAGTVHNYFTQGTGNNMQINTNVDEANTVVDTTRSQWKLVLGSSLDWFSIRRSAAGATYDENALFFIEGSTGNVGIATVDTNNAGVIPFTPGARLDVQTGSGDAVHGVTSGTSSLHNLDTGVFGWATATSGITIGAGGESDSTSGRGVEGYASATSGTTYGVYGESWSPSGYGVCGLATATTGGTGVYGGTDSPSGTGVVGYATASAGSPIGVYGYSAGPGGLGLYGIAVDSGIAVRGYNASTSGWGGYFTGRVYVNGTLYKDAGGFRIDHPLDPSNKYLNHSFVESPDMMNLYNGQVTLDGAGQAWVELPDWFEALNQGFRYQLTPIGASMPDLYIAQEIQDNRFLIAGGAPGMQVSWQVTGIRHDPYAEVHRIIVEEDKPPDELGTYLHPELYGQSAELAAPDLRLPSPELPTRSQP
jgi:hypothetical protein